MISIIVPKSPVIVTLPREHRTRSGTRGELCESKHADEAREEFLLLFRLFRINGQQQKDWGMRRTKVAPNLKEATVI